MIEYNWLRRAQLIYKSLFYLKVNDFQGSVVVERGEFNDPSPVELHHFFIIHFAHPEIDFSEIFLHLYSDTVKMFVYLIFGWNEAQEDVLP